MIQNTIIISIHKTFTYYMHYKYNKSCVKKVIKLLVKYYLNNYVSLDIWMLSSIYLFITIIYKKVFNKENFHQNNLFW